MDKGEFMRKIIVRERTRRNGEKFWVVHYNESLLEKFLMFMFIAGITAGLFLPFWLFFEAFCPWINKANDEKFYSCNEAKKFVEKLKRIDEKKRRKRKERKQARVKKSRTVDVDTMCN